MNFIFITLLCGAMCSNLSKGWHYLVVKITCFQHLLEPSGKKAKLENLTLFTKETAGGEIIQQDHCENPVDQKNTHDVQDLCTTGPPPCLLFPEPLHERDNIISEDRNYEMLASTRGFQLEFANFKVM